MPLPFESDQPELGSLTIRLPNAGPAGFSPAGPSGVQFDRFIAYEVSSNYLTPTDGWSFTLAADMLSDNDRNALIEGAKVEMSIDGQVQLTGYIDTIQAHGSRSAGSLLTVEGRDWYSLAVDGHIDPSIRFKPSQTLADVVEQTLGPFGVTDFAIDAIANRNAITGRIYGTPTSKKGKPLKSYVLHEIKPYQQEGAHAFVSRVAQRFGLWIRPAADGKTVIVGQPDFDQPSRYGIRLRNDGSQNNNVTDWDVKASRGDQPSVIFCEGFGGGGTFASNTLRTYIVNPLVVSPIADIDALIKRYPGIAQTAVPLPALGSAIAGGPIPEAFIRALYLKDTESHTLAELQAYARRQLALHMRKSLSAHYTIEGHKLGGQPVAIDTIADVDDDLGGVKIPLWILDRRFSKRAGEEGTKTVIEGIRPGTLQF